MWAHFSSPRSALFTPSLLRTPRQVPAGLVPGDEFEVDLPLDPALAPSDASTALNFEGAPKEAEAEAEAETGAKAGAGLGAG